MHSLPSSSFSSARGPRGREDEVEETHTEGPGPDVAHAVQPSCAGRNGRPRCMFALKHGFFLLAKSSLCLIVRWAR